MSERTATLAIEALDKDKFAVQRSVQQVLAILYDYIPRSCFKEAEEKLFDAFFINGVELTSNTMRKEYEEWKKHTLDLSFLSVKAPIQPNKE